MQTGQVLPAKSMNTGLPSVLTTPAPVGNRRGIATADHLPGPSGYSLVEVVDGPEPLGRKIGCGLS